MRQSTFGSVAEHAVPPSDLVALFQAMGLPKAKAEEAVKAPKSANILAAIIENNDEVASGLDEKKATLMSALSIALSKTSESVDQNHLIAAILDSRLASVDQLSAAVKYLESHRSPIDEEDFNKECGVGFKITPEEIIALVESYVMSNNITGWTTLGPTISALKGTVELRWASPLEVKTATDKVFLAKFGPKEAAKPKGKPAKAPALSKDKQEEAPPAGQRKSVFEEGFLGQLHKPGGNSQIHPHLREAHLAATGGQVWTRFPPEPNGYLHIGHSKAIFVNFGYAAHHGGKCYLRYDDTNPEKEEARYFESILEMVRWLGFEPWKITYSSDYFTELYELAVELIKRDKAYVCHCSQEDIKVDRGEKRGQPRPCIHRNRPIEESLVEFEKMKNGAYKPKEANLRMKQDLQDGNPQMWDLTAYRVLETPHHRTHDKWKIYPTYDFTHCLVDSLENISHSLCTTEFIASRQSYDWLCDALEVYKPRQSEYGRLSLEGSIMSKRKILALVDEGFVNGWDDPRLYTLIALRRRGVPPGAIISFVSTLGAIPRRVGTSITHGDEAIEGHPQDYFLMVEKPLHPKVPELGSSTIPFTRTLYIEAEDFRTEDSKDYFRLAPGKTVGLFQAPYPITCTSFRTDTATGEVVELLCKLENEGPPKKPKAFIQWVAEHAPSGSPVKVDETRIFNRLFKSDRVPSDFRSDIAPNSLEVINTAVVEVGFWSLAKKSMTDARKVAKARTEKAAKESAPSEHHEEGDDTPEATSDQLVGNECVRFQGLRVAYFALDKDSRIAALEEGSQAAGREQGDYIVLNRIVSLKEDSGKS
ncbi:unnamed protein product [Cyclocybe aegerita]|uniref:glutamine--tRNA ligase n=1 Tax=Cyclocybe aegerita TaxID=1973307 RepID=A0A8S0VQH9_CYCAE|nr:unnamed protein product [Cyclocybe aegerita]